MARENGVSRERMVRVPIPFDDHLIEKAKKNPENPHRHIGTEINALIREDFEKTQRRKAAQRR